LGLVLETRGQLRPAAEAYERAEQTLAFPEVRLQQVFGAVAFWEWNDLRRELEAAWYAQAFGTIEWTQAVQRVLLWSVRSKLAMLGNLTAEPVRAVHYGRLASDMMPDDWFSWLQRARGHAQLGQLQASAD